MRVSERGPQIVVGPRINFAVTYLGPAMGISYGSK